MRTTLEQFHYLQGRLAGLELKVGSTVEQIAQDSDRFPPEVIHELKSLLLEKRDVLQKLGYEERKRLSASDVVSLREYRRVARRS